MANIKSAKKRILVIKKKTLQNKMIKSALKTDIKKAYAAVESNASDKNDLVKNACRSIDKAQSHGLLHKNTAARKKSKLTLHLNASN